MSSDAARIVALQPRHLPRAGDVLAAAFHDDPGYAHNFPAPGRRARELRHFMAVPPRDALSFGACQAAVGATASSWASPSGCRRQPIR